MGIDSRELKRGLWTVRVYTYGVAYALMVSIVLLSAALSPASALQLDSTAYSRVASAAQMVSLKAAQRVALADAIAAAAIVPTPVGLGIKVVAVGLSIGIPLGISLWETYYPATDLAAVKASAAVPPSTTLTSGTIQSGGSLFTIGNSPFTVPITFTGGSDQFYCCGLSPVDTSESVAIVTLAAGVTFVVPSGWLLKCGWLGFQCSAGNATTRYYGISRDGTNQWTTNPGGPATQPQISTYVQALPSSNVQSIETHTQDKGLAVTSTVTEGGTQTQTISQTLTDTTTVVKPSTQVATGDVVVAQNQPAPSNTTINTTTNTTTNNTTTTTTVTNPNGSTTTTSTTAEQAASPCTSGSHDARTMATVLQAHQQTWQATGLVSSITALKNLVFPGAVPVLSFSTHLFGSFSVDMNQYTWVFLAIKSILFAVAGMVAIRLVFAGS